MKTCPDWYEPLTAEERTLLLLLFHKATGVPLAAAPEPGSLSDQPAGWLACFDGTAHPHVNSMFSLVAKNCPSINAGRGPQVYYDPKAKAIFNCTTGQRLSA